ncbi:MAG: sigma-54-dependent Fis family transcriptional regulator [Anaerolineaceae bacterium]|nr:MAG: sigma-54-dependent Fis family transcriptional regulator [Anaerolineaceae bacterium]
MSALPRILIIDDDFGRITSQSKAGGKVRENPDREAFCVRAGIKDVTGDKPAETIDEPVAEAVFISGLCLENGQAEQDLEGTCSAIRRGWEKWPRWSLILLDLHFKTGSIKPDGIPAGREEDRDPNRYFGLTILERLRKDDSLRDIPVVILSAMEREKIEERFSKSASDFVDKSKITRAKLQELLSTFGLLADDEIIGHSVTLLKCLREARVRSRHGNDNILVLGESGTGKELIAKYIHKCSKRVGFFVPLFTQGVPETLIDDRLCGHEPGAYTGSRGRVEGTAERAGRGTLFIDEFGDVPASIQPKLLRLLDKNIREIERLGSTEARKLDLQVVLATNRFDLLSGQDFRADLLARVNVADPVLLPPLRERAEDIRSLATHFLRKYEREFKAETRKVSDDAWHVLIEHDWPDNIRGLERVIERAVYKWKGLRALVPEHLNLALKRTAHTPNEPSQLRLPGRTAAQKPSEAQKKEQARTLDEIIEALRNYHPDMNDLDEWKGRLDDLQDAHATLLSKLVKVALLAKRDYTGQLQHTPAMRLLTGRKLAAKGESSIAYSAIKSLLSHHEPALQKILEDPLLKQIYNTACEKRSGKKAPNKHDG